MLNLLYIFIIMKLNIYAVLDNKANALVRFGFGNNDTSFVRDNLPNDIYNAQTKSGLPFPDLDYKAIGSIDTETYEVQNQPIAIIDGESKLVSPYFVDKEKSYQFKIENPVEKKDK